MDGRFQRDDGEQVVRFAWRLEIRPAVETIVADVAAERHLLQV
jgi:hypothetical protein